MNIKNTFSIVAIGLSMTCYSQSKKTYSGNYGSGTAIYQYYESVDSERILDGNFSFKSNGDFRKDFGSYNYTEATGIYDENQKVGKWVYSNNLGDKTFQTTKSLTGKYELGKKVGEWIYSIKYKSGTKLKSSRIPFFVNDKKIIGNITTDDLAGTLDSLGRFIGTWTIKDKNGLYQREIEYVLNFKENILVSAIFRNFQTGEILFRYNNEIYVNQYLEDRKSKNLFLITASDINPFYDESLNRGSFDAIDQAIKNKLSFLRDFFDENELNVPKVNLIAFRK
jgi:hypothetical protein